jgi:hypothetical protein
MIVVWPKKLLCGPVVMEIPKTKGLPRDRLEPAPANELNLDLKQVNGVGPV